MTKGSHTVKLCCRGKPHKVDFTTVAATKEIIMLTTIAKEEKESHYSSFELYF